LALGYLNQPELTATQFIANPFVPEARLYKTGDLGKWQVDGNVAFMGRHDHQVKIRGYRIELGEIESVLRSYPGIADAAVIAREDSNGDKELVAYITGSDTLTDATVLGAYLGGILPFYMVPAYFVQLPALPLNANGKVDRKQLPAPEGMGISSGVEYVEPRNEIEQTLLKMWQELLGKEKISIKDNFFAIGGHSLKATKLVSQISKEFGVKLPLPVLFSNPTIEHLASEIEKTRLVNSNDVLSDAEDIENISL
jgi:acyl carrier protein